MTDDIVLSLNQVSKTFRIGFFRKKVEAVRSVSFEIRRGEIFGLVGPNGAGKSTSIKMITGLLKPDAGQVSLFGEPVGKVATRQRLGYLPENPMLYEHLKPLEIMDFYGGLLGMSKKQRRKRGLELLEMVGMSHALDRQVGKMSKGMKQRTGIAQALLHDPELVILDEPQSGLDPIGRREIRDLVVELRRQGKTILFCSHILPDVEDICDRVALIHQGEVKEVGFLHELLGETVVRYELFARDWSDALTTALGDQIQQIFVLGELRRVELRGDVVIEDVLAKIAEHGARVESLQPHKESLEDMFVRDTKAAKKAEVPA